MLPSRHLLAIVVSLLAVTMLTGCSSRTSQVETSSQLGSGIDAGAGSAGGDSGDNLGATMPKDFPAEIPVPQAILTNATTMTVTGKRSWALTFEVDGPAQEVFHAVIQAMRDRGFEVSVANDSPDDGGALFTKGPFNAVLTSTISELQLTVSRAV